MKKPYFFLAAGIGAMFFVQSTAAQNVPEYGIYDSYSPYVDQYRQVQNSNYRPSGYVSESYFSNTRVVSRGQGNIVSNGYNTSSNVYGTVNASNLRVVTAQTTYPGCSRPDIVLGSQIWASCNALEK